MKFLACSRCLEVDASRRSQPAQDITNPLMVTKRPTPKLVPTPVMADESSSSGRRCQLPKLLLALTPWRRRGRASRGNKQTQTCQPAMASSSSLRRSVRIAESQVQRRQRSTRYSSRPVSRTQRLIRLYEERAKSPVVQEFNNDEQSLESHQNFKNKLNSLDFRRMNTVALENPRKLEHEDIGRACRSTSRDRNRDDGETPPTKLERKTLLEDFLRERQRIELAVDELLCGTDPGSMALKKGEKDALEDPGSRRVRFAEIVQLEPAEIEVSVDTGEACKLENFYAQSTMTFLKDATVEDKSLVIKLTPKDEIDDLEEQAGMRKPRQFVFKNFGKLKI
ncbi:hypothetical protein QAD02_003811 [Eretmocerus hayati]|uniref:Uncharacterized protein n=1 Tax=Eretmocerus hayati TaxID=131215 RepID=A0ACC2NQM1_9HYME|nr:hypothetical protein QAD02_003811 [Eretmocerus hayati]